jgi:hypothetical protein
MSHPPLSKLLSALTLALALPCAHAQTAIDETRTISADARVEVHNLKGSIRIVGTSNSELRVSGELGDQAELKAIGNDPDSVEVRVEYPNSSGWGWGGRGGDTSLVVEVPLGVQLDVSAVSADIDISGISGEQLAAESVSGSIQVRDSGPERLNLSTVSGSQTVETAAVKLQLESVSGEISLQASAADQLGLETVSGAVDIVLAQPARDIRIETVSGSTSLRGGPSDSGTLRAETLSGRLRIELPAATSARITAESFSGRIRSAVGTVEKEEFGPGSSLSGELGAGGGRIQVETFSGALEILVDGR